ncbi:hypothetical protein [Italian clover phyllody phytoplasma]|uniref:hypothetical protein n=1 Tax=Italian clover phyllody phytoplasma TaxID=1196420 RepID=UPI0002F55BC2|nr:hypothetical protein [Italian clover phyllody phytoplasma]
MKKYDFNVLEREDIPNILKYFNLRCDGVLYTPSYNAYQQTYLYYHFKNPPQV